MSDEFLPCIVNDRAAEKISTISRELCYALIDTEIKDILNVYAPGTSWVRAAEGARNLECGYAKVICEVTHEVLPLYKIYRPLKDLSIKNLAQPKSNVSKIENLRDYEEMTIHSSALRKFVSTNVTTFVGILIKNEVVTIFPRGTAFNQINNLSFILEGDIVLVKAKAIYNITSLAKIEKTYEQLRQK